MADHQLLLHQWVSARLCIKRLGVHCGMVFMIAHMSHDRACLLVLRRTGWCQSEMAQNSHEGQNNDTINKSKILMSMEMEIFQKCNYNIMALMQSLMREHEGPPFHSPLHCFDGCVHPLSCDTTTKLV